MSGFVVEGVSFERGGRQLFEDLNLEIAPDLFTTISGPNGVGKSTLLELLAGLHRPDRGLISLGGQPIVGTGRMELARKRSYLPSPSTRDLPFTVSEIIEMGSFPWAGENRGSRAEVDEIVGGLELGPLVGRAMSTLSSGEARRVEIARVLAQSTDTMLFDEPLASLDLRHAELVMTVLAERARHGATVVAVVHDLNAAARHADKAILLGPARDVWDGAPADVFTSDLLSTAYSMAIDVVSHGQGRVISPGVPTEPCD